MPFGLSESSFTLCFDATAHGRTDAGLGGITLDDVQGNLALTTDPNNSLNLRLVQYKVQTNIAAHEIDSLSVYLPEMLSEHNAVVSGEMGGVLTLPVETDHKGAVQQCDIPLGEVHMRNQVTFGIRANAVAGSAVAGRVLNVCLTFAYN